MKKRIRMIVDISMTVILPLLMAYSLIGKTFHEIAGITMSRCSSFISSLTGSGTRRFSREDIPQDVSFRRSSICFC